MRLKSSEQLVSVKDIITSCTEMSPCNEFMKNKLNDHRCESVKFHDRAILFMAVSLSRLINW